MKKIVLIILFLCQNIFANDFKTDINNTKNIKNNFSSISFRKTAEAKIGGNAQDGYYLPINNPIYKNLKFVKTFTLNRISYIYQIIDEDNNIFFLNSSMEIIKPKIERVHFTHERSKHPLLYYNFKVEEKNDKFFITAEGIKGFSWLLRKEFIRKRDEETGRIIWKYHKKDNKKVIETIEKNEDDELFFIGYYGMANIYIFEPYYSSWDNQDIVFSKKPKQTTLIIKKYGKYSFFGIVKSEKKITSRLPVKNMPKIFPKFYIQKPKDEVFFDEIIMMDNVAKLKNNNLVGYYNITKIKYKSLSPFDHFLARFVLPNGETGYIDDEGNEYKD